MNNAQAILNATAHLHMLYGLANDLNGAYGSEPIQKLMGLYAEAFNHITAEVLPMLGMSSDSIEDLVAGIDEAYEEKPYRFKPSIVAV